jgi:heme o synthase
VLTAGGGFFLATGQQVDLGLLAATLVGTALVIASACVFNNYIDRDIDAAMTRTQQRALVTGAITPWQALAYGTALGAVGFGLLAAYVNWLTVVLGAVGFVVYVAVYGFWKRRSVYGTLVGSVAGSVPVVAGYCAVTNQFDMGAVLLFLIMTTWQMPHFFAIALRRLSEYTAAGLPVLPVRNGAAATKRQIVGYMVAYLGAVAALTIFGYAGWVYLLVMMALGIAWLRIGLQGFAVGDDTAWAKRVFGFSLLVLLGFSVMIAIDGTGNKWTF